MRTLGRSGHKCSLELEGAILDTVLHGLGGFGSIKEEETPQGGTWAPWMTQASQGMVRSLDPGADCLGSDDCCAVS